jgi:hypothetical protein
MSFQTSALILSWVAILLLALVVSGLIRQVHALSSGVVRPVESVGLRPGAAAPGLSLLGVGAAGPVLLLFLSADCRTCAAVLDEAVRHAGHGVPLRVLYAGPIPAASAGLPVPVHGEAAELFERYDAIATPFAVLVDRSGRVDRSEPVGSAAALRALLDRADAAAGNGADAQRANQLGGTS